MATRKPKDLMLAEVAYNTFYEEQPQVFFDDLNHGYQMRWVRAVRSVVSEQRKLRTGPNGGSQPVREIKAPKAPSKKAKKANGTVHPDVLQAWDALDEQDQKLVTDKRWSEKSKAEVHAIQRIAYRKKQREKRGHSAQQNATA